MNDKINKRETTEKILKVGKITTWRKVPIPNIIFPKWDKLPVLATKIFAMAIKTKEQPSGCLYDEENYRPVLRILKGQLLINGMPDVYAWPEKKVQKNLGTDAKEIGYATLEARTNLEDFLNSIEDVNEKKMLEEMFMLIPTLAAHVVVTTAEDRECIEVTEEMHDDGITACVDEWMPVDDDGNSTPTLLSIGDYLVVNQDESGDRTVYRVGKEEFHLTHDPR